MPDIDIDAVCLDYASVSAKRACFLLTRRMCLGCGPSCKGWWQLLEQSVGAICAVTCLSTGNQRDVCSAFCEAEYEPERDTLLALWKISADFSVCARCGSEYS